MAFRLPVVAFDLRETRVSAEGAGVYVPSEDVAAYAEAMVELLDSPGRREDMGREGRQRIETNLGWPHQRNLYVGVYDELVGRTVQEAVPTVRA
jgi:glycosyltransferase involved in cell wall biosynthesis